LGHLGWCDTLSLWPPGRYTGGGLLVHVCVCEFLVSSASHEATLCDVHHPMIVTLLHSSTDTASCTHTTSSAAHGATLNVHQPHTPLSLLLSVPHCMSTLLYSHRTLHVMHTTLPATHRATLYVHVFVFYAGYWGLWSSRLAWDEVGAPRKLDMHLHSMCCVLCVLCVLCVCACVCVRELQA
jgi:hypothetical protein